ncbi:MAG: hypothetical protein OIF48_15410, partial [Silicimonas sp.]|nr:hypothetical protein [Silicimonas sp.]
LALFEAELEGGEGDPIAIFETGVEYYSGSDWTEGSREVRTRLDLPPGDYTLFLEMTEAEVDWTGGRKADRYSATVRQGVANAIWLWGVAAITGVVAFLFLGQRYLHHKSRWAGSDWSDE